MSISSDEARHLRWFRFGVAWTIGAILLGVSACGPRKGLEGDVHAWLLNFKHSQRERAYLKDIAPIGTITGCLQTPYMPLEVFREDAPFEVRNFESIGDDVNVLWFVDGSGAARRVYVPRNAVADIVMESAVVCFPIERAHLIRRSSRRGNVLAILTED